MNSKFQDILSKIRTGDLLGAAFDMKEIEFDVITGKNISLEEATKIVKRIHDDYFSSPKLYKNYGENK